jgi:uncharacterized protein YqjF (DUF2071 family)
MTPFLTAVWSDVFFATFAVPDETLTPYLHPGLTLDRWEGRARCSLVAFDFRETCVLGIPMPPFINIRDFPEFNLRFYVREGDRRGVVFVREFVPSFLLAGAARLTYNEPYSTARMTSRVTPVGDMRRVRHDFAVNGHSQIIAATARGPAETPADDTFEHWIKERAWGFGRLHGGHAIRYHVTHPILRVYPIEDYQISVETERLYGPAWRFLQDRAPDSVILAEGSAVSIAPYQS